MKKGIDYIGITVSYILIDPQLGILASLRSDKCRDEHFVRDMGGGGLEFGESINSGIEREIYEELGLLPEDYTLYRLGVRELFRKQNNENTHRVGIQHLVISHNSKKIKNQEPDKHLEIQFFPFDKLPPQEKTHSQFYLILEEFKDQIEKITGIKIKI